MQTPKPQLVHATVIEALDEDDGPELHIECRMSDGQKGAFAVVDTYFPSVAFLFAAAPDLLEALREIAAMSTQSLTTGMGAIILRQIEGTARAAISKAEDRT